MQVGDFEVEITSSRVGGGWQSIGILPDGKKITSGPSTSREDAEQDVKQQAEARLYPQRRYDVNRPFESMPKAKSCGYCGKREPCGCRKGAKKPLPEPDDHLKQFRQDRSRSPQGAAVRKQLGMESMNLNEDKWLKSAVNPEHKGYCTPMTKKTCTPTRKALASRFKKGDLHQEGRKYPEITESEEAIVIHQADQLLEDYRDSAYEIGPEGEQVDRPDCPYCGGAGDAIAPGRFQCINCGSKFMADLSRYDTNLLSRVPAKASFYPSDGGGGGGGGGFTSA